MKMSSLRVRMAVFLCAATACASAAQAAKMPSDVSVLAYGAAHAECLEWTDSCRTCMRSPDGRVDCSTPGIACVPKKIVCKREAPGK